MSGLKTSVGESRGLTTWRRWLPVWCLLVWALGSARAERYLTIEEAQRLCFSQADSFEAQTVRFTPDQAKAIESKSKVKVLNKGNRIRIARQGTNFLGIVFLDYVLGKHEIIDYAVAVGAGGEVVRIEILDYRESYGGEVRSPRWRDQFKGKTGAAPLRLNEDIYNITGATISCRHVTEGIKRLLATYEQVVRPHLLGLGELPSASSPPRR